jgi:hypothetical protein
MNIENIGESIAEARKILNTDSDDRENAINKIADEVIKVLNERIFKEEILMESSLDIQKMLYKNLELDITKSNLVADVLYQRFKMELVNSIKAYASAFCGKIAIQKLRGENE